MHLASRPPSPRLRPALLAGAALVLAAGCADQPAPQEMDDAEPRLASRPATAEIWGGSQLDFSAWWLDASGDSTPAGVRWSSSQGEIDGQGRFTAPLDSGQVLIVARDEMGTGRADTSRVSVRLLDPSEPADVVIAPPDNSAPVVAEGAVLRLVVRVANAAGALLDGVQVDWQSLRPEILTVDPDGVVTAHAPGVAGVEARIPSRGLADTMSVEVARAATASVSLVPAWVELPVGAEQTFVASALGEAGQPLSGRHVDWISSALAVAGVDSTGTVRAEAVGTTQVVASVEGVGAVATVVVVDSVTPVASVAVVPSAATLVVGQVMDFAADVRSAAGVPLPSATVVWQSSNPVLATVDPSGRVTARGAGQVQITASSGGASGSAAVTIETQAPVPVTTVVVEPDSLELDVGAGATLLARLYSATGSTLSGRPVTWSIDDPNVAAVGASGAVVGIGPGSTTIRATAEGVVGRASIVVNDTTPVVGSVEVTPDSSSVGLGTTVALTATVRAPDGTALPTVSVAWATLDASVATVDGAGTVTTRGVGSTEIRASTGGVVGHAAIVVTDTATIVGSIDVAPDSSEVELGATLGLTATVRAPGGSALPGVPVAWTSADATVATVDAGGTVTTEAVGSTEIRATAGGVLGRSTIVVIDSATVVGSVEVAPDSSEVELGATLDLTATVRAPDGSVLPVPVAWSTGDAAVLTVDGNGTVTTRGVGSTGVLAVAGGVTGVGFVNVLDTVTVVGLVSLSATSVAVQVGGTAALTATVRDTAGQVVGGFPVVWSTLDGAIATVDGSGTVTGVAAGTATIRATAGSATADAVVTVSAPSGGSLANECQSPGPGWVWCDDFDQDRLSSYFEMSDGGGSFTRTAGVGAEGSSAMRAQFSPGQVGAGQLHLALGRTPSSYIRPADAGTADYRELYWRMYVRLAPGWVGGGGYKLSRAFVFAASNWSQAMIAHVWAGGPGDNHLAIDPVRGTDEAGNLLTTGYNDFANFTWLGSQTSTTPIFDASHVGVWQCIETRVRLNDAGASNGVFELWVDGQAEAQRTGLNFVGAFSAYGLNAVFVENYWNGGAPASQERYIDNFVVSTQRIGC